MGLERLVCSKWYLSLEYFRYVPDSEISLEAIDGFLEKYPQELCCELTNACNFSCAICLANSPAAKTSEIPAEVYAGIIEGKPPTVKRITLTGGEPTLHACLPEMVAESSRAASGVVLSTNGSRPEKLEKAIQDNASMIVAISLHGSKTEHDGFVRFKGAYERALESVEVAASYARGIQIHTTIVPETLKGLPKLCETVAKLAIKEHRLNIVKPLGRRSVSVVPYEALTKLVGSLDVPYKISIKKRGQPFLFISCKGTKEIRHVRGC